MAAKRFRAEGNYHAVVPDQNGPAGPRRIHHRPSPQQWTRIVVDRATEAFEARPVIGRCPPDTICDGWSTPDVVVRMASSRGDAHRHGGLPRQDHAVMNLHPATGTVIFAVLDGVSSASVAHLGAQLAGHSVLEALWRELDADPHSVDWTRVFTSAADTLLSHPVHGLAAGETLGDVEARLGTTVVAGAVRATAAGPLANLARVGDSGAWWLKDRDFRPIFPMKGSGETFSSAVEALPRLPERIPAAEVLISRGSVLLAMTDGIGDPLGDGTGLVAGLLAEVLADPPPILGLAHAIDFSRETFDDDRTLLAIWPRSTS